MNDHKRLEDILREIKAIQSLSLRTFEEFESDLSGQRAVMYSLIIMGEAANQVSPGFQDEHSEIPWSAMIGTRNVVVHGYDQVKLHIVWEIVQRDLSDLQRAVINALQK